jgi:Lon protease-like protein
MLFPGCQLDLQLFEPRYLDMLGRCLKQGSGFGVVGILEGREVGVAATQFSPVGCEALIRDWQQLPNGLLGIRVEGGRRFRVNSNWIEPDQLTCGEIEWLEEAPEQPLLGQHADLAALLQTLAEHPLVDNLNISGVANGQQMLANQLAYLLPFSIEEKALLLELKSPLQRLEHIQILLEKLQGTLQA